MESSRYMELVRCIDQEVANSEQFGPASLGGLSIGSAKKSAETIRELLWLVVEMADAMRSFENIGNRALLQKAREATGGAKAPDHPDLPEN